MENYFDKKFELRYSEMDRTGDTSPTTILTLLEETAADHCASIDKSLYVLREQDIGWVLLSGVIKMDRYPNYKETINIRTWMSSYSLIKGNRENIIYDEQENIIGRAKGVWVFFDIKRRRPVQIFDEIKTKWSFCSEEAIKHNNTLNVDVNDSTSSLKKYDVNRFDIDMYKHLNNIRYLQWVIDSIEEDVVDNYFLNSIEGRFVAEAKIGESIVSLTRKDINENSFDHAIKVQDNNKVCATAKTVWKKKNK
jgi:medium-chain acyl-[acyl-carrier-protein] hydrolase